MIIEMTDHCDACKLPFNEKRPPVVAEDFKAVLCPGCHKKLMAALTKMMAAKEAVSA